DLGPVQREPADRPEVLLEDHARVAVGHRAHPLLGTTRTSTAVHPLWPAISGLTSTASRRSPRSSASTDNRASASAAAPTSAGGFPRRPSSSRREASRSMTRPAA